MVRRQTFDEFLNSPGPSTPRGGGRGRGRGGGGGGRGFRGGSGGGYGASPRSSFNTDYTNVPLDYSKLNSKTYTKLEGYDVAPFGPESNTNQNGSPYTPRGRGRGRGRGGLGASRLGQHDSPAHTPSGARTPVTGLGYHGQGHSFPSEGGRAGRGGIGGGGRGGKRHTMGDTVGKTGVMWGGGSAPIFVKAGELFKDGEVDIIKTDRDDVTIEKANLADAAVPQMQDPRDDFEVELVQDPIVADQGMSTLPDVSVWTPEKPSVQSVDESGVLGDTSITTDADLAKDFSESLNVGERPAPPDLAEDVSEVAEIEAVIVIDDMEVASGDVVSMGAETAQEDPMDDPFFVDVQGSLPKENKAIEDAVDDLFFVDTEPIQTIVVEDTAIIYETKHDALLGQGSSRSPSPEAEEIIFKPRKYAQPKPISVHVPSSTPKASSSKGPTIAVPSEPEPAPQSLNRRQKKALKREKRSRNKGKAREKNKKRLQAYEGSDIEWGSDGPPSKFMDMDDEASDDEDDDEAILRDYLKGTVLGHKQSLSHPGEEDSDIEIDIDEDSDLAVDISRAFDAAALVGDEEFELSSGEEDNPDIEGSSDSEEQLEEDDDDQDDEDDSSVLGGVEFHWAEARDGSEDDDDDDDGDDMFKGKDDWNDTEWFIKNLEDALDGDVDMKDRKSRNALFSTIENGDFGDDWGLMPVKRNKKKGSGIPLELQGQWEKDRQRKAEKKRQRDLERLADLIDPYPATHGKKKGKSKGLSRIEQARLAHLIPESATRVAEMFDIPSDFDEPRGSRMNGRLAALLPGGRGFASIDVSIKSFIADEGKTTFSVPPMDKEGRKKIHMLAECYGLTSKSRGKGKARFTVLTKTHRTGQNLNEDKISRLVAAAPFSGGQFYKALYSKAKKEKGKKGPGDRGSSARMRDGETVGEGAERIGMDNIGHQLLSKMGWAEGSRIGRTEGGLENPVIAIVKSTKAGLGA